MRILIRQGEGAAGITRIHDQLTQARAELERNINLALNTEDHPKEKRKQGTTKPTGHRSAAGDERRLRAIPVTTKGVPGTVPGTDPLKAILARERKDERQNTGDIR